MSVSRSRECSRQKDRDASCRSSKAASEIRQRRQTLLRLRHFRAVWIPPHNFTPGPAFVVEFFVGAVEGESYSLPVVAIEAAVIQVVTELRRAAGWQLASLEAAFGFAR